MRRGGQESFLLEDTRRQYKLSALRIYAEKGSFTVIINNKMLNLIKKHT